MIAQSLGGLGAFLAYFAVAVALCVVYLFIYTRITPHDEFGLITREGNASAAIAIGMSLVGFALPLASAIFHSRSILDCAIWGAIALVVQLVAYGLARLAHPRVSDAIADNTIAAALWLGFCSIAAGILSAASMSY